MWTKQDLIEAVAGTNVVNTKAQAGRVVDAVLDKLQEGVRRGGGVQIIGFGTLRLVDRKGRAGRNPQTGEAITIAPRRAVKFSPGKGFTEQVQRRG